MTDLSKEIPASSPEKTIEQTPEHLLIKEEVINDLDIAVRKSQDGEIDNLQLLTGAVNAWEKANQNQTLKLAIKKEIKRRRLTLHQMMSLDIAKHGDPFKKRCNPYNWPKDTPGIEKNSQAFLLSRIDSLRSLFESL
jgi:hypothetical protein